MPRAFLIKHKRARVDSIADELLARHENDGHDDRTLEDSRSGNSSDDEYDRSQSSNRGDPPYSPKIVYPTLSGYGNLSQKDATMRETKELESLSHRDLVASGNLEFMNIPKTLRQPPPLLRMSPGSAFEKVLPSNGPLELRIPGPPRDGHRVLFGQAVGFPDISGQNILRDRLLNHPASAYVMTDYKHAALESQGTFHQASGKALDLKMKQYSDFMGEGKADPLLQIPQRQVSAEGYVSKKRMLLMRDLEASAMAREEAAARYSSALAAMTSAIPPFFRTPSGHFLTKNYLPNFGLGSYNHAMMANMRSAISPKKSHESKIPPISHHLSDCQTGPQIDSDHPPTCSVKPTFANALDPRSSPSSNQSSSPLNRLLDIKPDLRSSQYLVQPSTNLRDTVDTRSAASASPVVGGKRPARQPILGLEYIQNGVDIRLREDYEPGIKTERDDIPSPESNFHLETDEGPTTHIDHSNTNDMDTKTDISLAVPCSTEVKGRRSSTGKTPQPRKYICDVCGKGFSRSNTLVTHKRIHTGDKPFACELCGRAFRQPGNLTRHRLTHTTVKPYVCSQCGKAFNRASNLHTHMRTHTNYKPFICQYCGKGFHQKIDMKIHSYTHTGEKPHKCKKCGRGFKQLTHLTYHMRTHSDVKMYTCAYCGKGFNQKGNLQAHIYRHTGERPYRCEICNKGFTLASTLNTHRRTHADKKPFACQYCGKDFYQKNALKSHLLASHPYTGGESLL